MKNISLLAGALLVSSAALASVKVDVTVNVQDKEQRATLVVEDNQRATYEQDGLALEVTAVAGEERALVDLKVSAKDQNGEYRAIASSTVKAPWEEEVVVDVADEEDSNAMRVTLIASQEE